MGLFRRRGPSTTEPKAIGAALEREVSILRQMLQHYPEGQRPTFGAPTRCPSCGNFGFVQAVDPAAGAALNDCFSCGARWVVTRRALRMLRDELLDVGTVSVHDSPRGTGVLLDMDDRLTVPSLLAPDVVREQDMPLVVPLLASEGPTLDLSDGVLLRSSAAEGEVRPGADDAPLVSVPAEPRLDVLLVEDSELDAELIRAILAPVVPTEMSLYHATTSKEGRSLFANRTLDLVLLDLGLPDTNGIDTLRAWRTTGVPIAVVTGDDDLTLASAAKRAGAAEFVPKRKLAHLIDDGRSGTEELAGIIRRAALARP